MFSYCDQFYDTCYSGGGGDLINYDKSKMDEVEEKGTSSGADDSDNKDDDSDYNNNQVGDNDKGRLAKQR